MDEECPYCLGTGLAPGDGKTKCGFCDKGKWQRPSWGTPERGV